jgi:TM2 domain-containing membrane protein YozV
MSDVASWYYVGSFGQLGPLTKEQLEELIEGGVVERSTYLWKPGMQDWLPAGSVADFTAFFARMEPFQSPPPVPTQPSGGMPPMNYGQAQPGPGQSVSPHGLGGGLGGNYGASHAPAYPSQPGRSYGAPLPAQGGYRMPVNLQKSDKSRTVSGILQLIVPGIGRIYLGYAALGVLQFVFAFATCGILHVWSIIDGILLLSGQVRIDGYGRALED